MGDSQRVGECELRQLAVVGCFVLTFGCIGQIVTNSTFLLGEIMYSLLNECQIIRRCLFESFPLGKSFQDRISKQKYAILGGIGCIFGIWSMGIYLVYTIFRIAIGKAEIHGRWLSCFGLVRCTAHVYRYWMFKKIYNRSLSHRANYFSSPKPEHINNSNMYTQIFSNYSFSSEIFNKCQNDYFDIIPEVAEDIKNTYLIHMCQSLWMCATGITIWIYPQIYWIDLLGGLCNGGYAIFLSIFTFKKQKQMLKKLPSDAEVSNMVDRLLCHPKILKVVNVQYLLIEAEGCVGVCIEILIDHMLGEEHEELLRVVNTQLKEQADIIKIQTKTPELGMIIN